MSDTLTLSQVEDALHAHGYKFKHAGDTVMAQCPAHDGGDLNCQINANGYCTCYSHCGGFWLDEVFEELRDTKYKRGDHVPTPPIRKEKPKYVKRNYYQLWAGLPKLSELLSEPLKGVLPLSTLDELGWRWIDNGPYGLGTGVFIPYWGSSYDSTDEKNILQNTLPFCQVRHLDGPVRFNFPRDAEPTPYGVWMLRIIQGGQMPLFICEGTTDWVTLWENCIPAVAMPSSSAGSLLAKIASWCRDNGITLVYAGDNDAAGDRLRQTLDDGGYPYRVCQPDKKYKDWTDMFIAEGADGIYRQVKHLVFPDDVPPTTSPVDTILDVFPGATQLELR